MLQAPPNPPRPEEESEEPPIIAGEGRYTRKKGASSLGEQMGRAYRDSILREEKKRARELEPYRQQFVAKEEVAGADYARRQQQRTAADEVRQRRLAEQVATDARQAGFKSRGRTSGAGLTTGATGANAADEKKEQDALVQKFNHAKVELDKVKRLEESAVNKLRNEAKQLEADLGSRERASARSERTEQLGERETTQLERDLEELKREERELTTGSGKRDAKTESALRQVRRKLSDLNFKLRLKERTSSVGASRQRSEESKLKLEQRELKQLEKEIGEHESRLALIGDMLRTWQSKHAQPDLARHWRDFEQDLRNKLGIHIYR
ncbi:MAG: hypothetical protein U0514_01875 [Candidatus Andersenbacteria bacterium]